MVSGLPTGLASRMTDERKKSLMVRALTGLVRVYQLTFSAILGRNCRHLPTCSSYSIEAFERFGAWRGLWLTIARIVRCNPLGSQGYDPVPDDIGEHGWRFWRYGVWRKREPEDKNPG